MRVPKRSASGSNVQSLLLCFLLAGAIPAQESSYVSFGDGCPSEFGVPLLEAVPGRFPHLGSMFTVQVSNLPIGAFDAQAFLLFGFSNSDWQGIPLPMDLSPLGLLGCTNYVSVDAAFLMTSGGAVARFSMDMPEAPDLLGIRFYNQALVQAHRANPFGAVMSNAAEGIIGAMPAPLEIRETFLDDTQLDSEASAGTWGGSRAAPGPLGGDGLHGTFDPTIGFRPDPVNAPNVYVWNTDSMVIPGHLTLFGEPDVVTDGRFAFTEFVLESGMTVVFTGRRPVQISAWGRVEIGGTIMANGAGPVFPWQARPAASIMSQPGQPGAPPRLGGGAGGRGADSGDGIANRPEFNGWPGEDVRLPAGHAYLSRAPGTGGRGSLQFPASGRNQDVAFNIFGAISGMVGSGGGGGGYTEPGGSGQALRSGGVSSDPDDLGPPTDGGLPFDLFADAMGSLPPGTRSLEHFSVGGAGGGGGGSHPTRARIPIVGGFWKAGGGGTGGGGAIAIRSGRGLWIRPTGVVEARGGDGPVYSTPDDGLPAPGGGGSGGTILLQSALSGGIVQEGRLDTSGGTGGLMLGTDFNEQTRGGTGSPGFLRLETPDGVIDAGATIPSGRTGATGPLVDFDFAAGTRSLWYPTERPDPPVFLRYEIEAEVDGAPILLSDDPAVSASAADDPNGPLFALFQGARLDPTTGQPEPGSAGPWRRFVGQKSGHPDNLNLDESNAVRFLIVFNRQFAQDLAVTKVSVYYHYQD